MNKELKEVLKNLPVHMSYYEDSYCINLNGAQLTIPRRICELCKDKKTFLRWLNATIKRLEIVRNKAELHFLYKHKVRDPSYWG